MQNSACAGVSSEEGTRSSLPGFGLHGIDQLQQRECWQRQVIDAHQLLKAELRPHALLKVLLRIQREALDGGRPLGLVKGLHRVGVGFLGFESTP